MISFLNSIILYALPTIAIPILIHLFTKQKLKKIPFSSLEFLKEMRQEKIRWVKIKQILLIIIRTLIILMLVLAFARPALKEAPLLGEKGATARSSIAIILDNSLSMARTVKGMPVFDLAKKRAFELVDILKPGDEVYLLYPLSPGGIKIFGPKYNFESIKQTIQSASLSYYATDLVAAVQAAQKTLQGSSNINREIYLISDLQATGFTTTEADILPTQESAIKLFVLPLETTHFRNLAIQEVKLVNQILEQGKPAEIEVEITNFGNTRENNKLVQLFLNGKRTTQISLDIEPKATKRISFTFSPQTVGFQSGSVLLEEDDLARDNQRYFSFYVPAEINVLLVGNRREDIQYFQWALQPAADFGSTIVPEFIFPDQFAAVELNKYHVILLSNIPDIKLAARQKLATFVENGGGLIIVPGSDVNIREYNSDFNEHFNLPLFAETIGQIGSDEGFVSLGKIDFSHPIFQALFEQEEKHIESPQFKFAFKVRRASDSEVIIDFNNNAPFLLESQLEKGRVLLFTSAADPNWSDWAVKGIFAPLINRCVSYLAGLSQTQGQEILVGHEIQFMGNQETSALELEMTTPDERQIRVRPELQQSNVMIQFQGTELPGIYRLSSQNTMIGQWAVNVQPKESDIKMIDIDQFRQITGPANVHEIQASDDIENIVTSSRYGQELWKIFLIIALVLLIIEMLLYWERTSPELSETPVRLSD